MRAILASVAFALAASAAAPAHAQTIDPIARARDGFIECFGPDTIARTCAAVSNYRLLEGGGIANDGVVHMQNNPTIIVYGTSTLYMRDGMLCERVQRATIDAARITIDGQPADAQLERDVKNLVWENVSSFRELCSRYTADGDGAAVAFYADGVERPEMADRVIWVRPEDGYTLGAADTSPA